MFRIKQKSREKPLGILRIYTLSCLIFFAFSIFNVYNYKVYNTWSLVLFYIYEVILWIGIKVGNSVRFHIRFSSKNDVKGDADNYSFTISKQGIIIIYLIFLGSLLSFGYFLVLYRGSFNLTSFGSSLKGEFDQVARTKLEVVTQFILYAGSAVYLIVIGSKDNVSKLTLRMARICLFLPGLRGAFLGRRFTLAVETLIFLLSEYESIKNRINSVDPTNKKTIRRIVFISVAVVFVLLYIFSQRIVYTPEMMFVARTGDAELKPFWKEVYNRIGGQMSVLAYVSYYTGHAPYAFSYSYANLFLDFPRYCGLQTCRVFIQIFTSLFGLSPSYADMIRQVPAIARYAGYCGGVVSDFGKYFAPIASFLFGFIFSRVEKGKNTSVICHSLYPIVQVMCIFAPVYFFSVGDVDHIAFWVIILSPLCLSRYQEE